MWCSGGGGVKQGPSAARMGCWKAHWGTAPGMGGCQIGAGVKTSCPIVSYDAEGPLLFNVCIDPSEGIPVPGAKNDASDPGLSPVAVPHAEIELAKSQLVAAYKRELATFEFGHLVEPDLLPGLRAALSHFGFGLLSLFYSVFLALSLRPLIAATPGWLLLLAHVCAFGARSTSRSTGSSSSESLLAEPLDSELNSPLRMKFAACSLSCSHSERPALHAACPTRRQVLGLQERRQVCECAVTRTLSSRRPTSLPVIVMVRRTNV